MKIRLATLFPEMCEVVLSESIIGRARKKGILDIECLNIRDFTNNKHRRVDDEPYGGGMGMVMQAEPIYNCYRHVCEQLGEKPHTIYMTPKAYPLTQGKAKELRRHENIFILCGHYEGVDQRILDKIVDEEISIGDYVLTGGELPALVLIDVISRMSEGVLSDSECFEEESHFNGLLEYPHYTRPEVWDNTSVPEILLSGHHKNIAAWRHEQSVQTTRQKRPDLYNRYINSKKGD